VAERRENVAADHSSHDTKHDVQQNALPRPAHEFARDKPAIRPRTIQPSTDISPSLS
jgi:hypothetical protein